MTCAVVIVEDDSVMLDELCRLVNSAGDFTVIGTARSVQGAKQLLQLDYAMALVDLKLPDGDGLELIPSFKARADTAVVVLTVHQDAQSTLGAIRGGADGYCLKDDPALLHHMRCVAAGEHPVHPQVAGHLMNALFDTVTPQDAGCINLTDRERQTLEGLAAGMTYRDIADHLTVSPNTVPGYIKGLYRKLDVRSRSQAVYRGISEGWLHV